MLTFQFSICNSNIRTIRLVIGLMALSITSCGNEQEKVKTSAAKMFRQAHIKIRPKAKPKPVPGVRLLVDLHSDATRHLLKGANLAGETRHQTDIPKLQKGRVNVQFFVLWANPKKVGRNAYYEYSRKELDVLLAFFEKNRKVIELAKSTRDIYRITASGRIAALIGIEGAHTIDDTNPDVVLTRLKEFYDAGARYMSLTWNNTNSLADSAQDASRGVKRHRGLSPLGERVVREMIRLGMMIDISHVSPDTFRDILSMANTHHVPIIASHSNAKTLCNHFRNLTDDQIQAVGENGGIIGVNFHSPFLTRTHRSRIHDVVNHIHYIKQLAGFEHVAIGSDYDGLITPAAGLEHAGKMQNLLHALSERGYSRKELDQIAGLNFMRVLGKVEEVSLSALTQTGRK